mmetsp:Transcript_20120/g.42166  ORF Transcript_20120/g.42166 Transcript_20120/m.42166 type:complete len:111 (-) Transcript_20120:38-370(-)
MEASEKGGSNLKTNPSVVTIPLATEREFFKDEYDCVMGGSRGPSCQYDGIETAAMALAEGKNIVKEEEGGYAGGSCGASTQRGMEKDGSYLSLGKSGKAIINILFWLIIN